MRNSWLAAVAGSVCVVALLAGLGGNALALGICAVVLIALLCTISLRSAGRPSRRTLAVLAIYATAFSCFLAMAFRLHDPGGPLVTFWGFPVGTAMLVYGITPLGFTLGALYGLVFDSDILPEEKQREFLERYAGR